MECPKCKKSISSSAKYCGYCGKKFLQTPVSIPSESVISVSDKTVPTTPPVQESVAKCPKCGSASLQAMKKGASAGNAVVGALLLGPLGLAAGAIGANEIKIVCLSCGHTEIMGKQQ